MMSNPLTEERLNKLKDDAVELLQHFGILYAKNYGVSLYEKIKKENDVTEKEPYRLTHRDFDSVPHKPLFASECFVKQGEGAGSFGGWKKMFISENCSYGIDLHADENAFNSKKKPVATISTAGYKVASDVSQHYRNEIRKISEGMGLTEMEEEGLSQFNSYTWALTHPNRTNYIFQLHKATNGGGCCSFLSKNRQVEPEGVGSENSEQREELLRQMRKCANKAQRRDLESLSGQAFDRSYNDIPGKLERLKDWDDNGTEQEILLDMIMEACMAELRDGVLGDLKGPTSIKISIWYKTRGAMMKTCLGIMNPAWDKMQEGLHELESRLVPVITPALSQVAKVQTQVQDKIKSLLLDKIGAALAKYVTPFIKPMMKAFDEPLTQGFTRGKGMLTEKLNPPELPTDENQRNDMLDAIPRTDENVKNMISTVDDVMSSLEQLKESNREIFGDADVHELRGRAEELLLVTVDAAVYTVQVRLQSGLTANDALKQQILQEFDNDVKVAISIFMKEVGRSIFISAFKKLVSPVTSKVIEQLNSAIPDEVKDFVSIEAIYDHFIDFFVGEPIDKMVAAAYPLP